jgi:2-aminoadipate transaminase
VTSGAQQAIGLVAKLFVGAGDAVVLESPTYLGAIDTFWPRNAHLIALSGVAAELDASEIDALIRRVRPALLFVMPSCHTITGAVPPARPVVGSPSCRRSSGCR